MIVMFDILVYSYKWDKKKDILLKKSRGVCFTDVGYAIERLEILDLFKNPPEHKYPHQWQLIVMMRGYPHVVPFVVEGKVCFFKTIYANRDYKSAK